MPLIKTTDDTGNEIEAYTPDEVQTRDARIAELEAKNTENDRLIAEKNGSIKFLSQMDEAEKKNYDANTLGLLAAREADQKEINELRTKFEEKELRERSSTKTDALAKFHREDETLKANIQNEYDLLSGMPETTAQEIQARATKAARIAGVVIDPRNPIYQSYNGEPPRYQEKNPDSSPAVDAAIEVLNNIAKQAQQ